jgi:hypothetical protein
MELLLSNPAKKSKRRKKNQSKNLPARPFHQTIPTTRKEKTTMAKKSKTRRRRTSRPAAAAKRTARKTRRRHSTSRGRMASGFINRDVLLMGAGAGVGLAVGPVLRRVVPASIAANPYVMPAAKVLAGLVALRYLRRYSPSMITGLGAGLIGSGALDVINVSRAAAGKSALGEYNYTNNSFAGYGDPSASVVSPSMIAAPDTSVQMDDGSTIEGYTMDGGQIIDSNGNIVAYAPVSGYTNA